MLRMRAACKCGGTEGEIRPSGGQDVVYCLSCDRYQYNAPKSETGKAVRSVSNRQDIKPSVRSEVMQRAGFRCEVCGKPASHCPVGLSLGHIVSVADAAKAGIPSETVNSADNLIAECEECNLGHGRKPIPIGTFLAILRTRMEA